MALTTKMIGKGTKSSFELLFDAGISIDSCYLDFEAEVIF